MKHRVAASARCTKVQGTAAAPADEEMTSLRPEIAVTDAVTGRVGFRARRRSLPGPTELHQARVES